MNMKLRHSAGTLFVVLVMGMIIYLVITPRASEGFMSSIEDRCGVDLPSCSGERIRCMNGYCKSDIPSKLPTLSDLPMTPATMYPFSTQ